MQLQRNTDPLDAAYLAIGAARVMDAEKLRPTDGEMEAIQCAIDFAPMLQRLWEEVDGNEWTGVWTYDVCEPLGAYIVRAMCTGDDGASNAAIEQEARRLIEEANR